MNWVSSCNNMRIFTGKIIRSSYIKYMYLQKLFIKQQVHEWVIMNGKQRMF